jgi:hypothetical protein
MAKWAKGIIVTDDSVIVDGEPIPWDVSEHVDVYQADYSMFASYVTVTIYADNVRDERETPLVF